MLVFLISFALSGWHIVNEGPGTMSVRKTPAGDGWCKLYDNPVAAAQLEKGDIVAAELWWNPSAAAITAVAAGIVVLVMGLVFFSLIVRGASKSLRQQSGSEDRLRCALHYGTAWLNFLNVALIILCFRPLGRIHGVFGWRFIASNAVFDVPAALLILAGLLLWWFWLVRLGDATAVNIRKKVNRFFILWTPFLTAVFAVGVTYGLYVGTDRVKILLNLAW